MSSYANELKEKLELLIGGMALAPEMFVRNPGKDFTRNRDLDFKTMLMLLISMGGNSIAKELMEFFQYDAERLVTTSAFVQQRNKILPAALEWLFHSFTQSVSQPKLYKGYRLLAVDGSDLHLPTNPDEKDCYFQNTAESKGYNLLHLNALYDLQNKLYLDATLQPRRAENEHRALADLVDRSNLTENVILMGDRGYEGYNNLAHIERKGWNYLIRIRDVGSQGILSGADLNLPDSETFDYSTTRILTRKQSKEVKTHPETYRFIPSNAVFDFLPSKDDTYPLSFRVVRIKLSEGNYEVLMTNLDPTVFSPQDLKCLYQMRWGIETSFRELKYAVGLTCFHSKRLEGIAQEVFARLIMYNFSEMITSNVVIQQKSTQLFYQVNFTCAIHICMHFLRCLSTAPPPDVEALIRKHLSPVRPGRSDPRKIRYKSAVSFLYRVA